VPIEPKIDMTPWRHLRLAATLISVATVLFYLGLAQ
jgi:hypothetical protein